MMSVRRPPTTRPGRSMPTPPDRDAVPARPRSRRTARRARARRIRWAIVVGLSFLSLHASAVLLARFEMPPGQRYAMPLLEEGAAARPAPLGDRQVIVFRSPGVRHLVVEPARRFGTLRPSDEVPEWAVAASARMMERSDGQPIRAPIGVGVRTSLTVRGFPWPCVRGGAIEVMTPGIAPGATVHLLDGAHTWNVAGVSISPGLVHATITGGGGWGQRSVIVPMMPHGPAYLASLTVHIAGWWLMLAAIAWTTRTCRRRTRRRRWLIVSGLTGTATTLAVAAAGHAWTAEVADPQSTHESWTVAQRDRALEIAGPSGPNDGVHWVTLRRHRSRVATWYSSQWRGDAFHSAYPDRLIPLDEWLPPSLPELIPGGPAWSDPREARVAKTVGWPWRCFKSSAASIRSVTDAAGVRSLAPRVASSPDTTPFNLLTDPRRLVPLTPIPRGLIGNLAVWTLAAATFCGAIRGPTSCRRRVRLRRRRAGSCRQCGHAYHGFVRAPGAPIIARCPECGGI